MSVSSRYWLKRGPIWSRMPVEAFFLKWCVPLLFTNRRGGFFTCKLRNVKLLRFRSSFERVLRHNKVPRRSNLPSAGFSKADFFGDRFSDTHIFVFWKISWFNCCPDKFHCIKWIRTCDIKLLSSDLGRFGQHIRHELFSFVHVVLDELFSNWHTRFSNASRDQILPSSFLLRFCILWLLPCTFTRGPRLWYQLLWNCIPGMISHCEASSKHPLALCKRGSRKKIKKTPPYQWIYGYYGGCVLHFLCSACGPCGSVCFIALIPFLLAICRWDRPCVRERSDAETSSCLQKIQRIQCWEYIQLPGKMQNFQTAGSDLPSYRHKRVVFFPCLEKSPRGWWDRRVDNSRWQPPPSFELR